MARPRLFDEDELIDTALVVFREHGYSGATIRRLEGATGVGGRSLANTFGDKDGLFLRVLDRYHGAVQSELQTLAAKPGLKSVVEVFRAYDMPVPDDDARHYGCLMVTTAFEAGSLDPRIGAAVTSYRDMWRDFFRDALGAANLKKKGQRADFLLGAVWGAEAHIRHARDMAAGRPVANVTLQVVKGWK